MDKDNNKGFTLIEILIVIAIIGTLSTVVMVKLVGGREKAKWSNYVAHVSQVTKMVKAANAAGSFRSVCIAGTCPTTWCASPNNCERGCLGQYGDVAGDRCWSTSYSTNTTLNNALLSIGPIPKGVHPGSGSNANNYGTFLHIDVNNIRVYAYVGVGNTSYCDKFGWNTVTKIEASGYCYSENIPKQK